jgi:hypothetical protein
MNRFWRLAPWLARVPLVLAIAFFLFLAAQWLIDPTRVAVLRESGIKLESPAAITNMRGTGALFVPLAAVLVVCLSAERVLLGLRLLTTIIAGAFAVRWGIVAFDGMTPLLARVLRFEFGILVLSALGLVLETFRRGRQERFGELAVDGGIERSAARFGASSGGQ